MSPELYKEYGPLIGGPDLVKVLGFRTNASFKRAVRLNAIGVRIFDMPGRKGKFAMTRDVAEWLENLPSGQCEKKKGERMAE